MVSKLQRVTKSEKPTHKWSDEKLDELESRWTRLRPRQMIEQMPLCVICMAKAAFIKSALVRRRAMLLNYGLWSLVKYCSLFKFDYFIIVIITNVKAVLLTEKRHISLTDKHPKSLTTYSIDCNSLFQGRKATKKSFASKNSVKGNPRKHFGKAAEY